MPPALDPAPPARRRFRTRVQRSFSHRSDNLGHRVVRGAAIAFGGTALRVVVTIGSTAILARLLSPADFGYVVMATIVTEFAALLSRFGFGSVLIQRPRVARIQYDTVFWASAAMGATLCIGVFAFSFFAHLLFDDPTPGRLLRVMAFSFLIGPLATVPNTILVRQLMFRQDLIIDIAVLVFRAGTAILLAFAGFGVWSLVAGSVGGVLAAVVVTSVIAGFRPRLRFSLEFLRTTWRLNGVYFFNGVVTYFNGNIDLTIVGRLLGAAPLGIYQTARSLTDEMRTRLMGPIQRVLFPAFSALHVEPDRFRQGVLRTTRLFAMMVMPMGFGIAAVADELVPVLYGSQWLAMIPLLSVMSLGAGLKAAQITALTILTAVGQIDRILRMNLCVSAWLIGAMFVGSRFGLTGVALAYLASAVLIGPIFQGIAFRQIGLTVRDQLRVLGPPFVSAALMLLAIRSARPWLTDILPAPGARLATLVALGVVMYVVLMLGFAPRHREDVLAVARRIRVRRS